MALTWSELCFGKITLAFGFVLPCSLESLEVRMLLLCLLIYPEVVLLLPYRALVLLRMMTQQLEMETDQQMQLHLPFFFEVKGGIV